MTDRSRKVFERLYGKASRAEDLPWHRTEPPQLLVDALAARSRPGAALDVGCGAGTYSLFLARQGYNVTAVDFMPQAIDMVRRAAADAGLQITACQADVTTWVPPQRFDVVLDVGCLHSFDAHGHALYKTQLLRWLAPGGDFVLTHLGRRGWWDRWPIGPHRVERPAVIALMEPELTLRSHQSEIVTGMPLFMGGGALVDRYWFQRSG
ncbi:MAG: class I SAM-dependent methyltransferase [Gammaproteobacteria bacterium]|nr:class I SAM-dependent methyltransferase [Gammaproteobacteria bacterium]